MNKVLGELYIHQEQKLKEMIAVDTAAGHFVALLAKYLDITVEDLSLTDLAEVTNKQLIKVKNHYANICLKIYLAGGDSINRKEQ